jgi:hypothetical protein
MSATARAVPHRTGPERTGTSPQRAAARTPRSGGQRAGTHRTGSVRTGALRTGTVRTGTVRTGTVRTGTVRTGPVRRPEPDPGRAASHPVLRLVPGLTPSGMPARAVASARRAPFLAAVVMLLVGTTLGLLFLNTSIAVDSLHATALRQANEQKTQEVERLQQQVTAGRAPAALAVAATAAGLVPAGAAAYLVVEPDGTSTVRGSAEPAAPPSAAPPTGG